MDGRVPVEAQLGLAGLGVRPDLLDLARRAVVAEQVAALVLGVDVLLLDGVREGVEAVAVADVLPVPVLDAACRAGRPHPGPVVLEPAVDVVREAHVGAHLVELGDGQRSDHAPVPAPVVGDVDAAVGAEDELVRVLRIDPERVVIAVDGAAGECRERRGEGVATVA